MEPLIDVLIYFIIIGGSATIAGSLIYGIYRLTAKIRRANARIIWRRICEHRRRYAQK
jgi:hypothetical protein